ncbi:DMT family transporter [Halioxenophilus aromaticivorans]|uniref:EamA family transporter n=1 Tax=Halioxenophilus aromaticivorans TaxID=1306992 RepID=A0AAV3UA12_9ALTE
MPIALVYAVVVLIWSTTPLAIFFSNADFGFSLSVLLRMAIGVVLVWLLLAIGKRKLLASRNDWRVGALASIGIFPAMPLVYWATQFVPTGLVSLMFSSSPFFVGGLSWFVLGEAMGARKVAGVCVAFVGMAIIFLDQMQFGMQTVYGILVLIASTFFFSCSAVLLKKYNAHTSPLQQAGGSMLFALPGLLVTWLVVDGSVPSAVNWQPSLALLYLAVVGSVVGFSGYFYLLKNLTASSVSLISMLSPVLAMGWGFLFKGEVVNIIFLTGAAILLLGLGVYSGVLKVRRRAKGLAHVEPNV